MHLPIHMCKVMRKHSHTAGFIVSNVKVAFPSLFYCHVIYTPVSDPTANPISPVSRLV